MKTTTLRILFTAAILVGMAAAPDAQVFRWQAGRDNNDEARIRTRIESALRTAQRQVERTWDRIQRQAELRLRAADRKIAVAQGMRPLRADGFEKVKNGITSIAEVARVT